jgi:HK97 family phage major capsid protein
MKDSMEINIVEMKETHKALRAQARNLMNQVKTIEGRAAAEGRDLTTTEQVRFLNLSSQMDKIADEALAMEREIEDAEAGQSTGRMVPAQPINGQSTYGTAARILRPQNNTAAELFGKRTTSGNKFASLGELALTVAGNPADPRLQVLNAGMTEGTGASGGFLVPAEFMGQVLDEALALEVVRPRSTVLPMTSNALRTPGFDYLDGTNGKRAGLQLLWSGEASTLTEQVATAREVTFAAKKASILVRVSSELTEDAPAFDRQLNTAMIAAVASGLDIAFLTGTGAGQPLGMIGAPATISVAKETSQANTTINLQNLVKMLGRLAPGSYRRSVWLAHPTTLPQLYALTVAIRNVADTENVGGSFAGVTQSSDGTLRIFGLPVIVTDACAVLGAVGDIILCDLSQYAIGLRKDATIQRSNDAYFATDEIGFKLTLRCDGQPLAASPTKLRDGTNTVSCCVTLAARG